MNSRMNTLRVFIIHSNSDIYEFVRSAFEEKGKLARIQEQGDFLYLIM